MRGLGIHVHSSQPSDPVQRRAKMGQHGDDHPPPVAFCQTDPRRRVESDMKAAAAAAELVEASRDLLPRQVRHGAREGNRAALERVADRDECVFVLLNEGAH